MQLTVYLYVFEVFNEVAGYFELSLADHCQIMLLRAVKKLWLAKLKCGRVGELQLELITSVFNH
jgi:hypothetical protein